jgi:hypothetical protein
VDFLRFDFRRLVTIELSGDLFEEIYSRNIPNVLCLYGESGRVLQQFLIFYADPALFYLDAHPSGYDTTGFADRPGVKSVVERELRSILTRGNQLDVIVVDDVDNPGLEEAFLHDIVSDFVGWEMRVAGDFPHRMAMVTHKGRITDQES